MEELSDIISRRKSLATIARTYDICTTNDIRDFRDLLIESFKALTPLNPTISDVKIDNSVHLCDSCRFEYPDCNASEHDIAFGNGVGGDNICMCNKYYPLRTRNFWR